MLKQNFRSGGLIPHIPLGAPLISDSIVLSILIIFFKSLICNYPRYCPDNSLRLFREVHVLYPQKLNFLAATFGDYINRRPLSCHKLNFPTRRSERKGITECPTRSLDLSQLQFFVGSFKIIILCNTQRTFI